MNIDGIDPSQISGLQSPVSDVKSTPPIKPQTEDSAKVETETLENLVQNVKDLPENRPDVVARGKELLNDPNYPSAEVEDQVAKILLGLEEEAF